MARRGAIYAHRGDLPELLRALAMLQPRDVRIEEPGLDDVFRDLYEDGAVIARRLIAEHRVRFPLILLGVARVRVRAGGRVRRRRRRRRAPRACPATPRSRSGCSASIRSRPGSRSARCTRSSWCCRRCSPCRVGVRSVAGELEAGTLELTLARPLSRDALPRHAPGAARARLPGRGARVRDRHAGSATASSTRPARRWQPGGCCSRRWSRRCCCSRWGCSRCWCRRTRRSAAARCRGCSASRSACTPRTSCWCCGSRRATSPG